MSAPADSEDVCDQFHTNFLCIPLDSVPIRFPTVVKANGWMSFRTLYWVQPSVWHGTTLYQLGAILQSGVWRPGLWHPASQSSPLGVWVTSSPSMAIDRASMSRGYGFSFGVPDGWDCPVAIGFDLPRDLYTRHGRPLVNGVDLFVVKSYGRSRVPLLELNIVEVRIFRPLYDRFQTLPSVWPDLTLGRRVLCRTRQSCPEDVWSSGHGAPWCCGRATTDPYRDGWIRTGPQGTGQWRCPECDGNARNLRSCATGFQ